MSEDPGVTNAGRGEGGGAAPASPDASAEKIPFFSVRRLWPLAVIVCGIAAFFAFSLDSYVTFDTLKQNRSWLMGQVAENRITAVIVFIAVYAAIVGLSLPGAAVISITGGFFFGTWFGTAWNIVGATIGATLLFLGARTVFADVLHSKAGPWLLKVESNFQENAFSYLLFLRLVPVFPFFAVNLVPAFLGVRLRTFVVATFIGIIPGALVYTAFGAGLGDIFDRGEEFSAAGLLTPGIIAALIGLAILSLLPVGYRWWRRNKSS